MKKSLLFICTSILVGVAILFSCQKSDVLTRDEGLMLKAAVPYNEGDCEIKCIDTDASEWTVYEKSYTLDYDTDPVTSVTVKVYNDATQIVYTVTSTARMKYLSIGGVWYINTPQEDNDEAHNPYTAGPIGISLPTSWEACDNILKTVVVRRNQENPTGNPEKELVFETSYDLIGICDDECDEAGFSFETENDNLDIVFSYNHEEEVNLTIDFTFPQIMNSQLNGEGKYVGADGKIYTVNNPKKQSVFTWTGVVSCKSDDPTTFAFSVLPDCKAPPANDGQAVIWTDAKITAINGILLVDDPLTTDVDEGPISLKGTLSNIVYDGCPVKP